MKFFHVRGTYRPKGCRKYRGSSGYVFAESREEAIEKFKASVGYHKEEMYFSASEEDSEVIITRYF